MQTRSNTRYFLGCALSLPLLLVNPASGQDALRALIELDAQRQTIEADIVELESRYGPYDETLLEPLQALIAIAQSQGDLERAAEIQNRRLQITRTVLGFESPALVSLLVFLSRGEQLYVALDGIKFSYFAQGNIELGDLAGGILLFVHRFFCIGEFSSGMIPASSTTCHAG